IGVLFHLKALKSASWSLYGFSSNTKVGFINRQNKTISWIAPGIGMVKSVTYKRNGNVLTTVQLENKNW
ncbi:MAG: hypothetical protein AAFY00_01115, partial [Bacteroidota bacterium]